MSKIILKDIFKCLKAIKKIVDTIVCHYESIESIKTYLLAGGWERKMLGQRRTSSFGIQLTQTFTTLGYISLVDVIVFFFFKNERM